MPHLMAVLFQVIIYIYVESVYKTLVIYHEVGFGSYGIPSLDKDQKMVDRSFVKTNLAGLFTDVKTWSKFQLI
jgi:hypothetical protein